MLPQAISNLAKVLARVPSIGPKSAERLALWFSGEGRLQALELGEQLKTLSEKVGVCPQCGYFSKGENQFCSLCSDSQRLSTSLCLIENPLNVIDIELSGAYKGLYFVLGGLISPLDGKMISDLPFDLLKKRVQEEGIRELIIALGATTESDVTTMYIKEFLSDCDVVISVLGRGLAVGTQIHYAGKKSLAEAFRIRENLK